MICLIQAVDGTLSTKWSVDPVNELAGLTFFTTYPVDVGGKPADLDWIAISGGVPVIDPTLKAASIKAKADASTAKATKIATIDQLKKDLAVIDATKLATLADVKPVLDKILKIIGG